MGHNFEIAESGSKKAPTSVFEGEIQKQTELPAKIAQGDAVPKTPAADAAQKAPELSPLAQKSVDAMNAVNGAADTALKGIVDGSTKLAAKDKLPAADQTTADGLIGKFTDPKLRAAAFKELSGKFPDVAKDIVGVIQTASDKVLQGQTKTFEDNIKTADSTYDKVSKDAIAEFQKKGPDGKSLEDKAKVAQAAVDAGTGKAQAAFEKLAPADQQKANALVEQIDDPKNGAAAMKDLTAKYPTVAAGITEAKDALTKHEATFKAVNALEEKMGQAAGDSVVTRQAYSNALKMAGHGGDSKAQDLGMELMMLQMGASPSDLKPEKK